MTYKHLTFILFILLTSFNLMAQKTREEKDFVRSLIREEYTNTEEIVELNITEPPYFIKLGEEYDRYHVYYHIITHEDLNNDGIDDYIITRESLGMLGGNVNTNQEYRFYIMKNAKDVEQEYSILGYAPFSYNIIDSIEYDNKRLTAHIVQNFRTYYMTEDLQTTTVNFEYKDGNLYEDTYLSDCQMGQMKDKTIFKADIPNVKRVKGIDMHNYTEVVAEECSINDAIISASLSGCDNLELNFEVAIKNYRENQSSQFGKTEVQHILEALQETTRYKTILNRILENFNTVSYNGDERISEDIDNTWHYTISAHRYDDAKKVSRVSIYIKNTVNKNQEENWDITTRRKE